MESLIKQLRATDAYLLSRRLAYKMFPNSWFEVRSVWKVQQMFRQAGVTFVHVPRAAGWSISTAVYGGHPGHFTVDQFIRHSGTDVLTLPRFAVVRNPWDRAVSAFHFARVGTVPGGSEIANASRYHRQDFRTFESYVYEFLGEHDVNNLDPVFVSQSRYVVDQHDELPFDHIGRFDRLNNTEAWLTDTLGRSITLPMSNQTVRKEYRSYYDAKTRYLVGRIYRDDIERFEFTF